MGQPSGEPEAHQPGQQGAQSSGQQPAASPAAPPPGWSPVQPPPAGSPPVPPPPWTPAPFAGAWSAPGPPPPAAWQPYGSQLPPGQLPPGQTPGQAPGWQGTPGPGGWGAPPAGWAPATPRAPKPGIVPLRPLGVGELLDGAIAVLRSRPRQTLLVAAVVAVVVNVVRALATHAALGGSQSSFADLTSPSPDVALSAIGDVLSRTLLVGGLQVVVALIGTTILTGLLTVVVSRAVLGQTVTTGEAWARVRPRLGALFGVTLLGGLLWLAGFLVAGLVGGAVALAGAGAAGAAVFGLLALVWVPFAVWLYVLVALAPVALVLEGQGVVASLRRSRALVAGAFWRTLGLLLLVVVIAGVVDSIIGVPFSVLGSGTALFTGDPGAAYSAVALTLSAVGGIVSQTITLPFTAAAAVLIYVDRRMRREGLDLELARAAGEQPPVPSAPPGGWTPGA